jgi:maltose-binding protein MalE
MNTGDVLNLFIQEKVAVINLGPWLRSNLVEQNRTDLIPRLGTTMPPGPAFMGGSVLAIWQHTRYEREVVDFIERLISPVAQASFCPLTGLLPARKEAWQLPELRDDPLTSTFYRALETSRTLSRVSVWGTIEEKLKIEISQVWDELFSTPDPNVEAILRKRLVPLARRLNITLGL